ncbi:VPS28-2, partial [Symbiodinium necroappetens]
DRRLKRNIQRRFDKGIRWLRLSEGEQVKWLLRPSLRRELRPVSFQLKRGPEAKCPKTMMYLKFGFIAQELEAVFPNLVRTVGDNTKAVASQDLIAVLTLAFQNLQKEHDDYKKTVLDQQRELESLKRRLDRLEAVHKHKHWSRCMALTRSAMAELERPRAVAAPTGYTSAEEAVPIPAADVASAPPAEEVASAPPSAPPAEATAPPAAPKRGTALSREERREAAMFAELYSIMVATEHLEAAFVRGAVSNQDYERTCTQLLTQFKTLKTGLKDKCPDIRAFAKEHGMNCPLAEARLLETGVAATALFGGTAATGKESLACFKASEGFITLVDAVKLNMNAVDELLPLVRDLQASIVGIPNLPPLAGIERIAGWLVTLNGMRASDRLTEEQTRQLAMDVEQAYTSLKNWLHEKT